MDIFRKWWFYLVLALVLIPVIILVVLFTPNSQTPAFLQSMTGTVEVDQGQGYRAAEIDMELSEADRIRTGQGTAIVVLYEHVIVRLEPNSEVTISDLAKGKQQVQASGSVWSKVAHLSGTDNYEISTPTVVATVRGTGFRVRFNGTHYEIITAEGEVRLFQSIMSCTKDDSNCGVSVNGKEKLSLDPEHPSVYTGMRGNLSAQDIADIQEQLRIELKVLQDLRLREVLKNDAIMYVARNQYDATDADVEEYLIDIDEGRRSESALRGQVPIMTPDVERIFAYNAAIKDVMASIEEYNG